MKSALRDILVCIALVGLVAGCATTPKPEDTVPARARAMIRSLEESTASLPELVPSAVIAATIVKNSVETRGTVADVCGAICLVRPNVEQQLSLKRSDAQANGATAKALEAIVDQMSRIAATLACDCQSREPVP